LCSGDARATRSVPPVVAFDLSQKQRLPAIKHIQGEGQSVVDQAQESGLNQVDLLDRKNGNLGPCAVGEVLVLNVLTRSDQCTQKHTATALGNIRYHLVICCVGVIVQRDNGGARQRGCRGCDSDYRRFAVLHLEEIEQRRFQDRKCCAGALQGGGDKRAERDDSFLGPGLLEIRGRPKHLNYHGCDID